MTYNPVCSMTRTFIALEMNEALQRHLAEIIRRVALVLPDVRWVDPAGIHLTLAFMGELTDEEVAGVKHAVSQVARHSQPFTYRLSRLGFFGSPRQPRVIWVGIDEPSGALTRLHQNLNRELSQRNFAVDTRPFSPHLTLARVRFPLPEDQLQQFHQIVEGPQKGLIPSEGYLVQQINVMKSDLQRSGARYDVLQAYPLSRQ
jgi:2'-5' RNA ligase